MKAPIDAVLFDMGGTLRTTNKSKREVDTEKIREMLVLLGMRIEETEFIKLLQEHARAYRTWAGKTLLELTEVELWTRWMLPDWDPERVRQHALRLNRLWREATVHHTIFPETKEVISTLFRRGYRLGLVSNTTSSDEARRILQELGIAGFFDAVVLSCVVGIRKPDPSILLMAARQMGVSPARCAYLGDQPGRDVAAARRAGFSKAIILGEQRQSESEREFDATWMPDHRIENLNELLEIFPTRSSPQPGDVYSVSFSTMWALKNFPALPDFFEAARRMGFARIELNHKVTSAMLAGIDITHYPVSSVHEPCPADISADELKKRDWLVSSVDEGCRAEGVKAIRRSIDLASQLRARAIVIHAGQASPDTGPEKKLRALIASGQRDSDECRAVRGQMIQARAELAPAAFASVKKTILELLEYAARFGVRLGIENRYHYMEFPSPDELEILLDLAGPDQIGFIYDVGHAEALDRMGFYSHEDWLRRFGGRILGTHLHDVIGTTDHYAPGLGEVDFDMVARYLPEDAFRTCEFQTFNTPEQVQAGLKFLIEHGCIHSLE